VQEVTVEWDHEDGYRFTISAINYIDARNAAVPTP
jgi:hypothetical protein